MKPSVLPFRTKRLKLRYFNESKDKEVFFAYRNDTSNNKFQAWPDPFTTIHLDKFFAQMNNRDMETHNKWVQLALEHPETGELIGDCAFKRDGKTVEIGITIRVEFQNQGYAKEGLKALIKLLAKEGVHRIFALLDVDNIYAKKLLEALGFRKEGHHLQSYWDEKQQEWRDEYSYAMLTNEISFI